MSDNYSAKDIDILEGLEPVRKRPGMYIGGTDSTGLHHLVWEALDNSVDEAINKYCDKITVTLHEDGGVTVEDNGRGIPVDKHPKHKKPALELIMTTLHSGAKFSNKSYSSAGGLHGVGISVVNALSKQMFVTVRREGYEWTQEYQRGAAVSRLTKGNSIKGTGTKIAFYPDNKIFPNIRFNKKTIIDRAETKAFLNSGLSISVVDERDQSTTKFLYENGIRDYLNKLTSSRKRIGGESFYHDEQSDIHVEVALQWTEETDSRIYSYANSVYTAEGGSHENGMRNALVKVLRTQLERSGSKAKGVTITSDDTKEGLCAVLSIFLPNPQYQGQTKDRLNNPEAQSLVESAIRVAFERFLLEHPSVAEAVTTRVILAAQARMASRSAKDAVLRKSYVSHRLTLPGKLSDCSSTDPAKSELFIVEGDSAGGSSKMARDRTIQAVLPIRGKILNVENASEEKLTANNEIKSLILSVGCGMGRDFDYSRLRYHKVIIMTDADVDGAHISALLLTFFYRYMPKLVEKGHIYLALPPLYKIEVGKTQEYFAHDDADKDRILSQLEGKGKPSLSRYKGLAEMPSATLKKTTMDPATRTLLKVTLKDAKATDEAFSNLMGKDASLRYQFIKENSEAFINKGGELDL